MPDHRPLYIAIGIDCGPDLASYPRELTWRGEEALPRLLDELPDVKWTSNIRADTQVRDYCGSAAYCRERYDDIWSAAIQQGSALAWHLHYFDRQGRQDTSEANILENIQLGSEAQQRPDVIHMGWTFQSDFSIRHLREAGVRIDYSPALCMHYAGSGRVDAYDWSGFAYRPVTWHGDIVLRQTVPVACENPAQLRARLLRDAVPALTRFIETVRHEGFVAIPREPQTGGHYFTTPTWREWLAYRRASVVEHPAPPPHPDSSRPSSPLASRMLQPDGRPAVRAAIAGRLEWNAVVTELVPNEVLAWKSVPDSTVESAGVIRFTRNDDGTTRVSIQMTYNPPAGAIGHAASKLVHADPKKQMDDDLARAKTYLETGTPAHDAAQGTAQAGAPAH